MEFTQAVTDHRSWSPSEAERLYGFGAWSAGYYGVTERGTVHVCADPTQSGTIDVFDVVQGLRSRELGTPLLLRFSGVLEHRLRQFRQVFDRVIAEAGYRGRYTLCYPIKVNQQRHVCEEIRDVGRQIGFGFEVGSKPELIAALGLTAGDSEMPIICNGFKDAEYLGLVILAAKLGRTIVPVIERLDELDTLLRLADEHGHCPQLGVRARLAAPGAGRWMESSGTRGKFGLAAPDLILAIERLRARGRLDALRLLHCHVGSQIQDIAAVKKAVLELSNQYVELRRLGAPLTTLDLGGGLGVDYDGSHGGTDASLNYQLEEYASDVVHRIMEVCDDRGAPHPNLITESGRAAVAYSSVLVVDVLGARRLEVDRSRVEHITGRLDEEASRALRDLAHAATTVDEADDPLAVLHDAQHALGEAGDLFALGHMTLQARAWCDELFWWVARRVLDSESSGPEVDELAETMADQYYCNFSLFQSLPDTWAIDQMFPIAPIHRLGERPRRRAVLGDITCDSDGRVTRFVVDGRPSSTIPVHALETRGDSHLPYYLGIFLVGAYQETLGDLHNLLGDTHAVHILTHGDGQWEIGEVVEGDTTHEVLGYVQYDSDALRRAVNRDIERAIHRGTLSVKEGNRLRRVLSAGVDAYTYLGEPSAEEPAPPITDEHSMRTTGVQL